MRTIVLGILSVFLVSTALVSCSKGGGSGEAALVVSTTPTDKSVQAASPGPFTLSVDVTSAMPPQGVTIAVTASIDGTSNSTFYTKSTSTTTAVTNFTLTGTPTGVSCLVNISVTSNDKASNVWTGSYNYSAK